MAIDETVAVGLFGGLLPHADPPSTAAIAAAIVNKCVPIFMDCSPIDVLRWGGSVRVNIVWSIARVSRLVIVDNRVLSQSSQFARTRQHLEILMALYAFDGTWNTAKENDESSYKNTNVVRFFETYD